MSILKIRFVGRFAFVPDTRVIAVPEPETEWPKKYRRMHVLGLDMQFNDNLSADPHRLLLSVPHDNVAVDYPEPFATIVSADPSDEAVREYLMWDLSNTSLSLNLAESDVIATLPFTHNIGGPADPRILFPRPFGVPVAFRFSASAGTFEEVFFDPLEPAANDEARSKRDLARTKAQYDLVKLGSDAPAVRAKPVSLPDGVLATFDITGPAILKIRGFKGTSSRTIQLVESAKAPEDPIICSITNTCGEQETPGVKDAEYAAFYDLLGEPPHILKRIVPRRVDDKKGGGGGRCYKQAQTSPVNSLPED